MGGKIGKCVEVLWEEFESCNKTPSLSSIKSEKLLKILIKGGIISFPGHYSLIPHVGPIIILR